MTNVYSFEGWFVALLLMICTCAYMRRMPTLNKIFLSEKKGFWGVFRKMSIIGRRLHWLVSLLCISMAILLIFH